MTKIPTTKKEDWDDRRTERGTNIFKFIVDNLSPNQMKVADQHDNNPKLDFMVMYQFCGVLMNGFKLMAANVSANELTAG